jgi:hypothetical protein
MRILDKNKDFYDYLAGIYGIDNTVFFDRRGSKKLTHSDLLNAFLRYDRDWFFQPETTLKRIQAGTRDVHDRLVEPKEFYLPFLNPLHPQKTFGGLVKPHEHILQDHCLRIC